jgi:hypothetical protein
MSFRSRAYPEAARSLTRTPLGEGAGAEALFRNDPPCKAQASRPARDDSVSLLAGNFLAPCSLLSSGKPCNVMALLAL